MTILRTSHTLACTLVLAGASVYAQPPIVVDWIQDGVLWNSSFRGVRTSGSGNTTMFLGGASGQDYPGCGTSVVATSFLSSGETQYSGQASCLDVIGISQIFCAYRQGVLVCMDVGASMPTTWVSGIHYSGWFEPVAMYSGPGTYSFCGSKHALLVSGGNFFLGGGNGIVDGNELDCTERIWKRPYPIVDLGVSWTTCLDNHFVTFEAWNDRLLAVGFPTVTAVDTATGAQLGTFDLFNGTPVSDGHTAISGDTMYWASRLNDGQMHVGRYLIGSGPVWEVTLPFSVSPQELFTDTYGRLWTTSGNSIIWLDQATGSFESYAYGQVVSGIDMVGNTVAVTGSMTGEFSYVLRGHVIP